MIPSTGTRDLLANRWAPFVHVFAYRGLNLTGATFAGGIRAVKDGSGAPLVVLANAASNAQGFSLLSVATETIDFGGLIGVRTVPVSYVQMRINETTMEGLPFPEQLLLGERGDDVPLWWDKQITPTGSDKYRQLEGQFIVHAGVAGSS